ncbi:SDR family oxidoreductase [Saccharopolyspora sp. NFXS83]|uniref:SDR family NAD(P)-dependent oxidoreductase n=1 Tax=Saccharopolyspora sp. NFXS83 TaxID=2993560 RepID=UPI00224A853A|nr:SDR family oxidoreductase [Saccharopolyspora sp. NFXS83]MCX2729797.1 SDR family oxidoreductase [Saccharopolyspora sp. NFXS83]
MPDYAGSTVLVTGASKGLGEAYARELASRGADLVLVARSADALERVARRIRAEHGVRVDVIAADLADREGLGALLQELDRADGPIDLLINNAGIGAVGPFLDGPLEPDLRSIDLNVTALITLVHAIGGRMRARGRGGIINVSSLAAFQPMPFQTTYAASKAFLLSFTEALSEELRGTGVRVMAAHPGPVQTGFFDATTAEVPPDADSPESVAAKTLDDFARGRTNSYPGRASRRLGTLPARFLPRRAVVRLAGGFTRRAGFAEARNSEAPEGR